MKRRVVEYPSVVREHFYQCEACGKEYGHESQAQACENKHRRDACPHPLSAQWWVASDGTIERTCHACGLWFNDDVDLDDLTDDQEVLRALVDAIRAAKKPVSHPP